MTISYDVTTASKGGLPGGPAIDCLVASRVSALPWKRTAWMAGQKRRISFIQLPRVDLGTMMRCGPLILRNSRR